MSGTNEKNEHSRAGKSYTAPELGEDVVISGIAGKFPESDNMKQLQENLLNNVDLITIDDRRWTLEHPDIPRPAGKINGLEKFDALYFGVHYKQAHYMDPMSRILLEQAYDAIVDAGINPRQLRGTRTGVFIAACFSESELTWLSQKLEASGLGLTGCARTMLPNRISYWLGVHGPSLVVDTACSSTSYAMELAYKSILDGTCDAALVGGANLCLHPYVTLQFARLGVLSPEGRCKTFDAEANGYVRSETIGMLLLQKSKDAKRVYARYIHGKTNCDGYKEKGLTHPSITMQHALLHEFYEECGVPSTSLSYVETHGPGTTAGDPVEVEVLDKVFCNGRTTPLKIGSIKSNLGHTESASGFCAIAKVVLAMESGLIAPNLHYKTPRKELKAIVDGRLQVVTEVTPWEGGYVGINSFGLGGANAHILLKSHTKEKVNGGAPDDDLPRLVIVSGRTEEAVKTMLDDVESRPVDVEHIALLHNIHMEEIPGHLYRGYTVMPPRGLPENAQRDIQNYPGVKRPIWFVFSGMGSQWPGMGESLMRIPIFAEAIRKCDAVLKPRGVDIVDILTNKDKTTFDNILNSFVGIAAVQIGLVDILKTVGIVPDNIIGHSVGELGCAYADGCFTAEQMVLSAYSRGLTSIETEFVYGSMAAVGLGYAEAKNLCPSDIEVACHNGPESCTISGPAESVEKFVAKLEADKIFAREVPCSNIAYHSRYIAEAGPKLLAYLKQLIPEPKQRSPKWLSTSVPRSQWTTDQAQLSSAEYHTNNLLNPVLFEETSLLIPKDAVTIEIAPRGLLQAILRRSLNEGVTNTALTQRGHKDNVEVLSRALGKLYEVGLQPQLLNLYPKVQFPVSRGTPMIGPNVRWEHSEDWYVTYYKAQEKVISGERVVKVELLDEDYQYMAGHVVDGRNLLPATGYLTLIWESIGLMMGLPYINVSVVFEDVKFHRATTIPKDGSVSLTLVVQKGTGRFEIVEGDTAVVTGMVRATTNPATEKIDKSAYIEEDDDEEEDMTTKDVYKELRLRGYQYTGLFRGIKRATCRGTKGHIAWKKNWGVFMDNMLQLKTLAVDTRGLFVPKGIQKIVIDTKMHYDLLSNMPNNEEEFLVYVDENTDIITSGGVEIRGLKENAINRRKLRGDPVLEEYKFVAHRDRSIISLKEAACLAMHLALENHQKSFVIKTIEVVDETDEVTAENLVSPLFEEVIGNLPLLHADVNVIAPAGKFEEGALPSSITISEPKRLAGESNAMMVTARGPLAGGKNESLKLLLSVLKDGGYLLAREPLGAQDNIFATIEKEELNILLEKRTEDELLILLRKRDKLRKGTVVVRVNNNEFSWVAEMKAAMKAESEREFGGYGKVLFVGQGDFENGLMGLVNCLRREPGGEFVQGLLIQDPDAPEFSLEYSLYDEQLKLGLALNVLRPGKIWGSYRHLELASAIPVPVHHIVFRQSVRGDLGSFEWVEGPIQPDTKDKYSVRVIYASLNFCDVMLGTGKLANEVVAKCRQDEERVIGCEISGIDSSGRRVMGICSGMTNFCQSEKYRTWFVPDGWTLEDAATVPSVYGTAYYALYITAGMKKGDKVLIHSGSGGVGQAAITLALHEGCEVYTTVGTPEKREFIKKTFPQIDDSHIGNSRDTSFEQLIKSKTRGRGVDIVLNSLAEEKLLASVRCLGPHGRFLEIGKFDLAANNMLGMEPFLKEISFHGIMMDNLGSDTDDRKRNFHNVVENGLRTGVIKPLVRTVFTKDETESAFRYMAAGKHIGKIVLRIQDEDQPAPTPVLGLPAFHCYADRSYLIIGGLGGFGLELADWLALRGAKKIVLTSRKGITNGYQRMRIDLWRGYGTQVSVVAGKDASTREGCEAILQEAAMLGPVDAIFNLAVVLKDGLCENQTEETFVESFRAKAFITKQLDELSRRICPQLRQFVVFSSVFCGRGNAGQTNYGMANSVMERICERRAAEGLPGLAIQWGAVGDVGLVADMHEDNKEVVIGGILEQKIPSCLRVLDALLRQSCPVVSSMVVAEKSAGSGGATNCVDAVMNIMGLKDLQSVSHHTTLPELGMDSMMAIEIKQTLEREFDCFLTAQDIRSLNFAKLIEIDAQQAGNNKARVPRKENDGQSGMKLLMRILGDEDINTELCLKLNTEGEGNREEIFLIPGIEGSATIFNPLIKKIRSPATCFQLGVSHVNLDSIEDMAEVLLPHASSRSKGSSNFTIVGYSYGAVVAFELARRLEAEGLIGRLILIDGAPDFFKALLKPFNDKTDDEIQNFILLEIMNNFSPAKTIELAVALENCTTWEDRLKVVTTVSPKKIVTLSLENQLSMCTIFYKRIKAMMKYEYSALPPINAPIVLLKPKTQNSSAPSEDYGLQKLTRNKVEVYCAEGNHITMLDESICAAAINGEPRSLKGEPV